MKVPLHPHFGHVTLTGSAVLIVVVVDLLIDIISKLHLPYEDRNHLALL